MAGVAIDVAGALVEVDELRDALEVVEDEDAVLIGKVQTGRDERGAAAFGSGLGVDLRCVLLLLLGSGGGGVAGCGRAVNGSGDPGGCAPGSCSLFHLLVAGQSIRL